MMDPKTKTIVHSRVVLVLWLNRMYFQSQGTPRAPTNELSEPVDEGNVSVSDSDESKSGSNPKKTTAKKAANSNSVDSFDSAESFAPADFDYTQQYGTQLDQYQQGPLEQEHKIMFQINSKDLDSKPGTTRSRTQYTLSGIELAALNIEDSFTKATCKLGTEELKFQDQAMGPRTRRINT